MKAFKAVLLSACICALLVSALAVFVFPKSAHGAEVFSSSSIDFGSFPMGWPYPQPARYSPRQFVTITNASDHDYLIDRNQTWLLWELPQAFPNNIVPAHSTRTLEVWVSPDALAGNYSYFGQVYAQDLVTGQTVGVLNATMAISKSCAYAAQSGQPQAGIYAPQTYVDANTPIAMIGIVQPECGKSLELTGGAWNIGVFIDGIALFPYTTVEFTGAPIPFTYSFPAEFAGSTVHLDMSGQDPGGDNPWQYLFAAVLRFHINQPRHDLALSPEIKFINPDTNKQVPLSPTSNLPLIAPVTPLLAEVTILGTSLHGASGQTFVTLYDELGNSLGVSSPIALETIALSGPAGYPVRMWVEFPAITVGKPRVTAHVAPFVGEMNTDNNTSRPPVQVQVGVPGLVVFVDNQEVLESSGQFFEAEPSSLYWRTRKIHKPFDIRIECKEKLSGAKLPGCTFRAELTASVTENGGHRHLPEGRPLRLPGFEEFFPTGTDQPVDTVGQLIQYYSPEFSGDVDVKFIGSYLGIELESPAPFAFRTRLKNLEHLAGQLRFKCNEQPTLPACGEHGHPDSYYVKPFVRRAMERVAQAYRTQYPTDPNLMINDASLGWGGWFDLSRDWGVSFVDHWFHRFGTDIDVRTRGGDLPATNRPKFREYVCQNGGFPVLEDPDDSEGNQHYHIYFEIPLGKFEDLLSICTVNELEEAAQ